MVGLHCGISGLSIGIPRPFPSFYPESRPQTLRIPGFPNLVPEQFHTAKSRHINKASSPRTRQRWKININIPAEKNNRNPHETHEGQSRQSNQIIPAHAEV